MAFRGGIRTPSSLLLPMQLQQLNGGRPLFRPNSLGRAPSLSHPGVGGLSPSTLRAMVPTLTPAGQFGGVGAPEADSDPALGVGATPQPADAYTATGDAVDGSSGMGQNAPPEAPSLAVPQLLAAPREGLATRAGVALANTPGYTPHPYESGGSAFFRGLLSGGAQGFSGAAVGDYQNKAAAVAATNKQRQDAADLANLRSQKTWETRLGVWKDAQGKWAITADMAKKYPALAPFVGGSERPEVIQRAIADSQSADRAQNAEKHAADALAETIRHNRAQESIERTKAAKAAKEESDPTWMQHLIGTTSSGGQFLDMSNLPPKEQTAAQQFAFANGAVPINKAQMDKLSHLETARDNIAQMEEQGKTFLPTNAGSRLIGGPLNALAGVTQSNPQIAAWNTHRIAAISQLVALAGGMGSGLRINQAEIHMAIQNDIPKVTDTQAVATQKFKNIRDMLQRAEEGILVRSRGPNGQASTPSAASPAKGTMVRMFDDKGTPMLIDISERAEALTHGWKDR